MSDERIRIAMADDHPVVRRGLRAFLESQPEFEVVIEAGDGPALVDALPGTDIDVILLDLLMPGGGAALIAVDGKPAKPYRVGAVIDTGLVLQSLGPRQARLGASAEGPASLTLEMPARK